MQIYDELIKRFGKKRFLVTDEQFQTFKNAIEQRENILSNKNKTKTEKIYNMFAELNVDWRSINIFVTMQENRLNRYVKNLEFYNILLQAYDFLSSVKYVEKEDKIVINRPLLSFCCENKEALISSIFEAGIDSLECIDGSKDLKGFKPKIELAPIKKETIFGTTLPDDMVFAYELKRLNPNIDMAVEYKTVFNANNGYETKMQMLVQEIYENLVLPDEYNTDKFSFNLDGKCAKVYHFNNGIDLRCPFELEIPVLDNMNARKKTESSKEEIWRGDLYKINY